MGNTDRRRTLVVSFHDVHPGSREVCARFIERVQALGVSCVSLLTVPRWHGADPISEDPKCVEWLREMACRGHEICLHGYFHRADRAATGRMDRLIAHHYTAREGEFFRIDAKTALERVRSGLDILVGRAGLPVVGFTPPAWLMSREGRMALESCGLHYTTTFGRVDLLQVGRSIVAPTLVCSCRNAWRRFVSRIWIRIWAAVHRNAPLLRIAAHPGDFVDSRLENLLYAKISETLASGRVAATYRDLLPVGSATPDAAGRIAVA